MELQGCIQSYLHRRRVCSNYCGREDTSDAQIIKWAFSPKKSVRVLLALKIENENLGFENRERESMTGGGNAVGAVDVLFFQESRSSQIRLIPAEAGHTSRHKGWKSTTQGEKARIEITKK